MIKTQIPDRETHIRCLPQFLISSLGHLLQCFGGLQLRTCWIEVRFDYQSVSPTNGLQLRIWRSKLRSQLMFVFSSNIHPRLLHLILVISVHPYCFYKSPGLLALYADRQLREISVCGEATP